MAAMPSKPPPCGGSQLYYYPAHGPDSALGFWINEALAELWPAARR